MNETPESAYLFDRLLVRGPSWSDVPHRAEQFSTRHGDVTLSSWLSLAPASASS
jgi:hypothetical protein